MGSEVDRRKNGKGKGAGRAERFNDVQFVNYNLTAPEKAECKAACPTLEELDDLFLKLLQQDYKVSIKFDDYTNGYAAFVMPVGDGHDHAGLMMSGRGSSPLKALKQALYIHFIGLRETWDSAAKANNVEEWDD